jgi:hypothetical protein
MKRIKQYSQNFIDRIDWRKIVLPTTSYYTFKTGKKNHLLLLLDFLILAIPFGTVIIMILMEFLYDE